MGSKKIVVVLIFSLSFKIDDFLKVRREENYTSKYRVLLFIVYNMPGVHPLYLIFGFELHKF